MPPACRRTPPCRATATTRIDALPVEPGARASILDRPPQDLLGCLEGLDMVVATTLNASAVMTHFGCYAAPQCTGMPLCLEQGRVGLRLHPPAFGMALAVDSDPEHKAPPSLQLFDREGCAVHRAFFNGFDDTGLGELKRDWGCVSGVVPEGVMPEQPGRYDWLPRLDHAASCEGFWQQRDGAFHLDSILGDGGLARRMALPTRGHEQARAVNRDAALDTLIRLADIRMPVTQCLGNSAVLQLHSSPLTSVQRCGALALLSSERSTLSLDLDEVNEAWITRIDAPGQSGVMLEFYDWRFHCVAQLSTMGMTPDPLTAYWEQMMQGIGP